MTEPVASTVLVEKSKVEYGRGVIAGLLAGFVWAFVAAVGIAIVVQLYHDKIVAYVQPRILLRNPYCLVFPS